MTFISKGLDFMRFRTAKANPINEIALGSICRHEQKPEPDLDVFDPDEQEEAQPEPGDFWMDEPDFDDI
jgi:hypothetical protein